MNDSTTEQKGFVDVEVDTIYLQRASKLAGCAVMPGGAVRVDYNGVSIEDAEEAWLDASIEMLTELELVAALSTRMTRLKAGLGAPVDADAPKRGPRGQWDAVADERAARKLLEEADSHLPGSGVGMSADFGSHYPQGAPVNGRLKKLADAAKADLQRMGVSRGGAENVERKGRGDGVVKNGTLVCAAPKSGYELVTPELAREWLATGVWNRTVSRDTVRAYVREMVAGQWLRTHQGIAMDEMGRLIDGQHRLLAVIMAGIPVELMVTRGLATAEGCAPGAGVMDVIDRGRGRSVGNQLQLAHGIRNGTVAKVCKTLATLCSPHRTRKLSVAETLLVYRAFQKPVDWVLERAPKAHGLRAAGVLGAFAFAMGALQHRGIEKTAVERCWERLMVGKQALAARRNAIDHLHEFLTSPQAILLSRGTDRGLSMMVLEVLYIEVFAKPFGGELRVEERGLREWSALMPEKVGGIAVWFALGSDSQDDANETAQ